MKQKSVIGISVALLILSNTVEGADGTALGELAESMAPGTWAELPTDGLQVMDAPATGGTAGHILAFAHEFMWDSNTRRAYFIGGDHNGGPERFVEYDAIANTWSEKPRPFWMSGSDNQNHSYSAMALDPRGKFWYGHYEYDINGQSWVDHGTSGVHFSSSTRGKRAHAYLAGLGNILYMEGAVYVWGEDSSGPWRTIRSRFALDSSVTSAHYVAIENPITNKVLFGGSDEWDQLYLIDSDETITTLGPTPLSQISNNGAYTSTITVDPGTGFYLVLSPSGQFWEFDSQNDRWTSISQSTPVAQPNETNWQNNIIGATCTTYNVSMYVRWNIESAPKMWLYKHSAAEPQTRSEPPSELLAD